MIHPKKNGRPAGEVAKPHDKTKEPSAPQAGDSPDGQGPAAPTHDTPLAAKARECRDLVDQLQRLAADYSNYQKRMERVTEDEKQRAVAEVVLDLLPAIDNFERALAAAQAKPDFASLLEGVRLVHAQLLAGLKKHGIMPIDTGGMAFNPEHHEAVAHLESAEHPEGQVMHEMHKGYLFHGRILRPSRVTVSKGKPEGPQAPPEPRAEAPGRDESRDDETRGE